MRSTSRKGQDGTSIVSSPSTALRRSTFGTGSRSTLMSHGCRAPRRRKSTWYTSPFFVSHGEFLCAGDNEALVFCREIAEEMVRAFGISPTEAVARVNRQWSEPGPSGRFPRTWIVGLNLAYHQTPDDWAGDIYYGK